MQVDESQALMKLVEEMKAQKDAFKVMESRPAPKEVLTAQDQERKMRVCDICGALLSLNEAETRKIVRRCSNVHA